MKNIKNLSTVIAMSLAMATVLVPNTFASSSHVSALKLITAISHTMEATTSNPFKGAEVNGGTATITTMDGKTVLKLSSDFKIPASPAPHFQVVDSDGNVYLLRRLTVKGDKTHRDVVIPSYIKNVAKVQIWCAFAEVVLGEATFDTAVMTGK
jgi:hypothetical protein